MNPEIDMARHITLQYRLIPLFPLLHNLLSFLDRRNKLLFFNDYSHG